MVSEPVALLVVEKVVVALNKDGGVRDMEVQGSMSLQVGPPSSPSQPCQSFGQRNGRIHWR